MRRSLLVLLALLCVTCLAVAPTLAQSPSVHLALGNPSGALADVAQPDNYLITKPQYALAYLRDDGIPAWVAWRLVAGDLGPADRCNCFQQDTSLPAAWPRVVEADYTNSGYDRGHIVSSEDRTASDADNEATFLMTNVLPQSPQNNRGPWLRLEETGRELAQAGNTLYLVAGPEGELARLAGGKVRVPAATWKVALVVPPGEGDVLGRITSATRAIAIRIPNDKADTTVQQRDEWEKYRVSVDALEAATGLDFFSVVSPTLQRVFESRIDTGPVSLTLAVSGTATLSVTSSVPVTLPVRVTDVLSAPVAGVAVSFAALGAGATFTNGDVLITATTGDDGVASVPVRANLTESVPVEASIAGVYTPATFRLSPAPAAVLGPERRLYLPLVLRSGGDSPSPPPLLDARPGT
jgi:endonuclease G